jgi:TatD DNase family protein
MELIDTHCHLYLQDFDSDRDAMIRRGEEAGVRKFYLPSVDSSCFATLLETEAQFAGKCVAMCGLHPCSVKQTWQEELSFFRSWLERRKFAAIGEIGLDFYWDKSFEQQQYHAFREQISWAQEFKIPIVIHSRESMKECIDLVRESQNGSLRGIFHCFGDNLDSARSIIDLGFKLGIGGILTYKKSTLPAVLKEIEMEHMVLETDAPYLSPVPFRGKRNESAYVRFVADKLAEIKSVPVEEVARITSLNALKLFGN